MTSYPDSGYGTQSISQLEIGDDSIDSIREREPIFNDVTAHFTGSVHPDIVDDWVNNGGSVVSIEDATLLFSTDTNDAVDFYEDKDLRTCRQVFHTNFIVHSLEAAADDEPGLQLHHYIIPPPEFCDHLSELTFPRQSPELPTELQQEYPDVPVEFQDGHVPEQFQNGHVPQEFHNGHVPEEFHNGNVPHEFQNGHVPEVFQNDDVSEDYQNGHMPEDYQNGHVPEELQNGHVPEALQNGHVTDEESDDGIQDDYAFPPDDGMPPDNAQSSPDDIIVYIPSLPAARATDLFTEMLCQFYNI